MQKIKKHISCFLLLVFSWVLIPASLSHEIFADHIDTDCHSDHLLKSTQVESIHTHCDVFKTNTPLYDVPELICFSVPETILSIELNPKIKNSYFHLAQLILPTRAPPTI